MHQTIDSCIIRFFNSVPSHKRVELILIESLFILTNSPCIMSCKHDRKWKDLTEYIMTNPLYIERSNALKKSNKLQRI